MKNPLLHKTLNKPKEKHKYFNIYNNTKCLTEKWAKQKKVLWMTHYVTQLEGLSLSRLILKSSFEEKKKVETQELSNFYNSF